MSNSVAWLWLEWFSTVLGTGKHTLPECNGNDAFVQMSCKSLWVSLGEGRPLFWVCCSHHCHLLGFVVTFPLLQRGTGSFPSSLEGQEQLSWKSHSLLPALPGGWNPSRQGSSLDYDDDFDFLKSCVPVLSNNLNGFEVGLFTQIACEKPNPNRTLSPLAGE